MRGILGVSERPGRLNVLALALLLFAQLTWFSVDAVAAGASGKAQTGKDAVLDLVKLISSWSGATNSAGFFTEAARRIDYEGMASSALTPGQWRQMCDSERAEYVSSFRRLVERRYYLRWHRLFQRSTLTITSEEKSGSDTYVKTVMAKGNEGQDHVVWRLHTVNNQPMVLSLNVNGKDLLTRLSGRLQRSFAQKGSRALIVWLNKRADSSTVEIDSDGDPDRSLAAPGAGSLYGAMVSTEAPLR